MTRPTLATAPAHVRAPRVAALDGLAPGWRTKLDALVAAMRADGHEPLVFETLRTDARQAYLHGYGRTWDDGRGVVTNSATAAKTWHGYGLAADLVCARRLHRIPLTDPFWTSMRRHCATLGIEWGGTWARFPDRPHVQYAPMRRSPSLVAQELHAAGRVDEVWRIVGADRA